MFREEFWDQFQSISDDMKFKSNRSRVFVVASRVLKVVLYALMFILILAGLMTSRMALLFMTSKFGMFNRQLQHSGTSSDTTSNASTTIAVSD